MEARFGVGLGSRISPLSLAVHLSVVGLLFGGFSAPAFASCATVGSSVTCTGVPTLPLLLNTYASAANGLTVNVDAGAAMNAVPGGSAIALTGSNVTLNNSGTIDPAYTGPMSQLSGALLLGASGAPGVINVLNNAGGILRGTGMVQGPNLTDLGGLAINVVNPAGGVTRIINNGTITSTGVQPGIPLADTPVVAVHGGGSQVNMVNGATGQITGRVAFESSAGGNAFTNAGSINGSVSLGANSHNTFTAVTGSSVGIGDGVQSGAGLGGMAGVNLTFAPTGQIDGGAGGTNNLILQNTAGVGGGTSGVGTASSATYVNFDNLTVNSGNWTLEGALVSGSTTLNGGIARFNDNATFGNGVLTSNGGTIEAGNAGLTLTNEISLGADGLTVQGSNDITLSGMISGSGGLTKTGSGILTLGALYNIFKGPLNIVSGNVYTHDGGAVGSYPIVNLSAGTNLYVERNLSLGGLNGAGNVYVSGYGSLYVGNDVSNTFDGEIHTSRLIKDGTGTLTLTGNNDFHNGSSIVDGGTLNVGGLLNSSVDVKSGATLTGSGSIQQQVHIDDGGHLALSSGTTMSVGRLILDSDSNVDVRLATPSSTPVLNIGGNLTLDGNLNVRDAGGFGVGVYRLFNYTGTLTDNGLTVTDVPLGYRLGDMVVQALSNQINLVVAAPNSNLRFWDGSQTIANGTVDGGSGTWSAGGTNWTRSNGALNQSWGDDFGIFQGAAGTVSVNGTQRFAGLQFLTDGYNLVNGTAGQLTAVNGFSGTTVMRVDPGVTATIGVNINGSGILNKVDSGTLVLNGDNSYSGGTRLDGGTLVVGSNTALGTGALVANADTQLESNKAVALDNAITLNSNLTVGGNHDLALNGVISGTGGLTKNGASVLRLAGNNNFLGPVTLNAGGLLLASNTALGSGALKVANDATLETTGGLNIGNTMYLTGDLHLLGNNDLTLSGMILGEGGLIKDGTGNLTLIGSNSSFRGTVLNGGTLTLQDYRSTGPGPIVVNGASVLTAIDRVELTNRLVLNADLTLPGDVPTFLRDVSGSGRLIKNGSSRLSIVEARNWTGGLTLNGGSLSAFSGALGTGKLIVGGDSSLESGNPTTFDNDIDLNANLTVTRSQYLTYGMVFNGVIAGTGTLTHLSKVDLKLTGANTFSGLLDFRAGSLTTVGDSALGNGASLNLEAPATLNLGGSANLARLTGSGTALIGAGHTLSIGSNDASSAFNGRLGGAGALAKRGTGTFLLTGDQPFNGAVSVDQGMLQVGSRAARGSLGGQVSVANGAILSGNGSVGSVVNHGVLVSGAEAGTLSVAGNLTNAADGVLALTVSSPTATPLAVGGTAALGGSLQVNSLTPFTGNTVYSLITAGGGVTGTFSAADLPQYTFLNTALVYDANAVNLVVSRNDTSFADAATTGNQRNTASALTRNGPAGAALQNEIANLNVAGARQAFDNLSGEIHASTASAVLEDSRFLREAVNDRMRQPTCSAADDPRRTLAPSDTQLSSNGCHGEMVGWARAIGAWGDMGGDSNTASVDRSLSGFMLGTDKQLDEQWRAGMAAGYTRSNLNAHDRNSDAKVDSYHLATYLNSQFDALAVRLGAAYSWHRLDTKREVNVGSYNDRLKARYDARSAQVFGEVGYAINAAGVAIEPFAGLAYVNYDSDTAREKGGMGRLKGDADQDITYSTLGVRIGKLVTLANGSQLTPRAAIGWRHAYGDTQPDADLTFIDGGASFSTQGAPIARDSALLEAGVDFQITPTGKLGIGYSGQVSSDSHDSAMSISFSQSF